jgi:quercetin 2,3-dioxygenase
MLDHFHLKEGSGFPDHPHRGQVTVTYMFEGSVQHEDIAGHKGQIGPGGLQWMTAGRGIVHAEMPVHGKGLADPDGLQVSFPPFESIRESSDDSQRVYYD